MKNYWKKTKKKFKMKNFFFQNLSKFFHPNFFNFCSLFFKYFSKIFQIENVIDLDVVTQFNEQFKKVLIFGFFQYFLAINEIKTQIILKIRVILVFLGRLCHKNLWKWLWIQITIRSEEPLQRNITPCSTIKRQELIWSIYTTWDSFTYRIR